MNKKITLALACVALAFTTTAQSVQPMASRALLEKRIYEVNTNLAAQISQLRAEIASISAGGGTSGGTNVPSVVESAERWGKNMDVLSYLAAQEATGGTATWTNVAEFVKSATDPDYANVFMVWDKIERNPYCATNAVLNMACWDFQRNGTHSYTLNTFKGETYTNINYAQERTFVCTTNSTRTLTLFQTKVDAKAWKMVMGLE